MLTSREVGTGYVEAGELDVRPDGVGEFVGDFDEPTGKGRLACTMLSQAYLKGI